MTIHQLKEPCWELRPPTDDERHPHYDTKADALEALREAREDDDRPYPDTKPVQLADRCWIVQCDGECEIVLDTEDEGWTFHHDTPHAAEATVKAYRWTVTTGPISGDELVYCDEDRPEGVSPPPSSLAELEAAGQLRLPGVA